MRCGKKTKTGKPCKNTRNCPIHRNVRECKVLDFISENFDKIFDALPDDLKAITYTPKVQFIDNQFKDGDFDKFGGAPSVEKNFVWPVCCKMKLAFFFQLTPPAYYQTKPGYAIQMFNCVECADSPFIRWIDYQRVDENSVRWCVSLPDVLSKIVLSYFNGYSIYNCETRDLMAYDKQRSVMYHQNGIVERDYKCAFPCYKVMGWTEKVELAGGVNFQGLMDRFSTNEDDAELATKTELFIDKFCEMEAGLKFGGQIQCVQGLDHDKKEFLHFQECEYMPYMWGDSGDAHIDTDLEMGFCCG